MLNAIPPAPLSKGGNNGNGLKQDERDGFRIFRITASVFILGILFYLGYPDTDKNLQRLGAHGMNEGFKLRQGGGGDGFLMQQIERRFLLHTLNKHLDRRGHILKAHPQRVQNILAHFQYSPS